ncbi:uncharacterized protein LOC62_06G008336 [Vanrija pseudolonga]|uniref:Uncharacterized protein n=1 Tax=Vanrija pseudolonga TaxID=143232 RepID=A0AAF0YGW5_9TREE|nr:hypothetical protein LOC62_06G008336 [Vanrija pseudolonga]
MPPVNPDRYKVPRDRIISHGVSPRGAKWERFRDDAGDEVYRYVNRDKSYTYHFPGGWSYVHDGKGFAEWRTPEGETYTFYGASLRRSHPYLGGIHLLNEAPRRRTTLPQPHRDVELDIPPVQKEREKKRAKTYARPYATSRPGARRYDPDDSLLDAETTAMPTAESSESAVRSLRRRHAPASIMTPPTSPDSPRRLRKRRRQLLWAEGSSTSYFDRWSGTSEDSRSAGSEPECVGSDSSDDDEGTSSVARRLDFTLSSADDSSAGPSRRAVRNTDSAPSRRRHVLVPVVEIVTPRKKKQAPESPSRTYGLRTPRSSAVSRRSGRNTARRTYAEASDDDVVFLEEEDADEAVIDRVLAL